MHKFRGNTIFGALAIIASAGLTHSARYHITMLAPVEGNQSQPHSINNSGFVVGQASDASRGTYPVAVEWNTQGVATYLTGEAVSGALVSAVNDAGFIIGASDSFAGQVNSWAGFTREPGGPLQSIGELFGPNDTDSDGRIVGIADAPAAGHVAAFIEKGVVTPLPSLDDDFQSDAHAVSDAGVIVGRSDSAQGPVFAVRWDDGVITNLGGLPGAHSAWFTISDARDINESGVIVGHAYYSSFQSRAVRWVDNTIEPLPMPAPATRTWADAVNDRGDIVGQASIPNQSGFAVLWNHGQMVDLNDTIDPSLGWTLRRAIDINNRGQIVGVGNLGEMQVGFRLDPICDGDLDTDGAVDVDDLNRVLASWGTSSQPPYTNGDADGDRDCDVDDLNAVLASWGCEGG